MDKQTAMRRAAVAHAELLGAEKAAQVASEQRRRALLDALAYGATRAELARLLHLDPSTISRLTGAGRRRPWRRT